MGDYSWCRNYNKSIRIALDLTILIMIKPSLCLAVGLFAKKSLETKGK